MPENSANSSVPAAEGDLLLRADRFRVERIGWDDAQGVRRVKDVIRHPGAVVILPLLADGRICLIRNRRVSVGQTLLEVPAGTLDAGESPRACALRELEEETGYSAGRLDEMGWFYVSPGILDEKMHLFVATELSPGRQNLMPDESIENHVITCAEAMELASAGEIHDAKTMIALLRLPHWRAANRDPNA